MSLPVIQHPTYFIILIPVSLLQIRYKREGALQSQARTEIELTLESLRLEIRLRLVKMGNGKMDIGLERLRMGSLPEHKHYECELTENDFLSSISFENLRVGGEWFFLRFF